MKIKNFLRMMFLSYISFFTTHIFAANLNTATKLAKVQSTTRPVTQPVTHSAAQKIKAFFKNDKPARIKVINLGNSLSEDLTRDGHLTSNAVMKIITNDQLPQTGKDVTIQEINPGSCSTAVFIVGTNKNDSHQQPRYIIKELNQLPPQSDKQIKCLNYAQRCVVGRLGYRAAHDPDSFPLDMQVQLDKLPRICLVEAHVLYYDKKTHYIDFNGEAIKRRHTVEIIHPAKGSSMQDLLERDEVSKFIEKCNAVGFALGLFHRATIKEDYNVLPPKDWKCMAHGDLHMGNFFCDENNKISFIDNAGAFYNRSQILNDINHFTIYGPYEKWYAESKASHQKILGGLSAFLEGYVYAYPINVRHNLATYCYDELIEDLTRLSSPNRNLYTQISLNDPFFKKSLTFFQEEKVALLEKLTEEDGDTTNPKAKRQKK